MINVERYRAFSGTMRIRPVNGAAPFEITGDWLYKPDTECWYGNGQSFDASVCEVVCDTADWISVKERLPERSERVIAYSPVMNGTEAEIQINRGFMLHSKRSDITHWMPLPEPPKEEATP